MVIAARFMPVVQEKSFQLGGSLTCSVFRLREQGLQVNMHTLRKEAARLSQNFKDKSTKVKISSMHWSVKKVGLSHSVSMHMAQKDNKETEEESSHFVSLLRQTVVEMDPDDISNMEQTLIPYSFHSNCTLDMRGIKTICM